MRLSDRTHGLKQTDLEKVKLAGDRLQDYVQFWDQSARTDAVRAIADSTDAQTFETSGVGEAQEILALAPANAAILEIGCGTGRVLQHLAAGAREVHGVDISREMVAQGSRRLAHLANVHFHHGNGYDLEMFDDARFDLVFSAFVFQHMPKTIAFNYFTEAARVLKPEGVFRVEVPNLLAAVHFASFVHFTQPYFVENPYPMNFYTPQELMRLLEGAGFGIVSLDDYMVAVARKGARTDPRVLGAALDDSERLVYQSRVAALEAELARMRKVYDHPLVRVALRTRARLRR